jgi:hypothetical protein
MQKKLGRPKTTGSGEQVVVRLHEPLLAAIDQWCAEQLDSPSRAEALRRLAAQALANPPRDVVRELVEEAVAAHVKPRKSPKRKGRRELS